MSKVSKPKKSVVVEPDGSVRDLLWKGFEAIQKAVGGDFETLFETDHAVGFVNDAGGYGLTRNLRAEQIAARLGVRLSGPVFGPLMLVGPTDSDRNETHCRETVRRVAYEPTPDTLEVGEVQRAAY